MNRIAQVAPQDIARATRNYLVGGGTNIWLVVSIFAGVIIAFVSLWFIFVYARDRRRPLLLFHELCELHGIPRRAQRQLLHLARTHSLGDPCLLFVCPDLVKQIQSLEMSETKSESRRRRLEAFFGEFMNTAFG